MANYLLIGITFTVFNIHKKSNMKKLQILFLLVFGLTFMSSCGDDIDCTDETAIEAEVNPLFDAADAAVDAYYADSSEDNCKALKDAIKDYIDVLEKYEESMKNAFQQKKELIMMTS